MYRHILIPLENSKYDDVILNHVRPLARMTSAKLTLIHVANGFGARLFHQLNLRESEEMKDDQAYLDRKVEELKQEGFDAGAVLSLGEPADEILRTVQKEQCDLIAMATHGHGFFSDVFFGSTARTVRHRSDVPVLLLKAGNTGHSIH